jgi:hypothetical protein
VGKGGEMTQTLYAHMNKKKIETKQNKMPHKNNGILSVVLSRKVEPAVQKTARWCYKLNNVIRSSDA